MVDPNDEEVLKDEATDQFAEYFKGRHPKILITTGREASGVRLLFFGPSLSFFPFLFNLRYSMPILWLFFLWCCCSEGVPIHQGVQTNVPGSQVLQAEELLAASDL